VSISSTKYCLDANVLIQAWNKYYSPKLCPGYWTALNEFGKKGRVFVPQHVFEEIVRTEDDLADWLKKSQIPVYPVDEGVTKCLSDLFAADASHQLLADNTRYRSMADPWVIAHAMKEKACVVTKEEKITTGNKVKIPNVCDNMGVRWINDFEMVAELALQFSCSITNPGNV